MKPNNFDANWTQTRKNRKENTIVPSQINNYPFHKIHQPNWTIRHRAPLFYHVYKMFIKKNGQFFYDLFVGISVHRVIFSTHCFSYTSSVCHQFLISIYISIHEVFSQIMFFDKWMHFSTEYYNVKLMYISHQHTKNWFRYLCMRGPFFCISTAVVDGFRLPQHRWFYLKSHSWR